MILAKNDTACFKIIYDRKKKYNSTQSEFEKFT